MITTISKTNIIQSSYIQ